MIEYVKIQNTDWWYLCTFEKTPKQYHFLRILGNGQERMKVRTDARTPWWPLRVQEGTALRGLDKGTALTSQCVTS